MRLETLMLASLMLVPSASADWLQRGHDGGASGYSAEQGPEWDSVAFTMPLGKELEAYRAALPVLVIGREVFTIQDSSIVAISLDSATVRTVAPIDKGTFEFRSLAWASDGKRIAVVEPRPDTAGDGPSASAPRGLADQGQIEIIPLDGGPVLRVPLSASNTGVQQCEVALAGDLYVACSDASFAGGSFFVQRRRLDGQLVWESRPEADANQVSSEVFQPRSPALETVFGISVVEDQVIPLVGTIQRAVDDQHALGSQASEGYYWDAWLMRQSDGKLYHDATELSNTSSGLNQNRFGRDPFLLTFPQEPTGHRPSRVAGDGNLQIRKTPLGTIAPGLADPVYLWIVSKERTVKQFALDGVDTGAVSAITPDRIYVATSASLLALDRSATEVWSTKPPAGQKFLGGEILADEGHVYVRETGGVSGREKLAALDAATGEELWSRSMPARFIESEALVNGTLVLRVADGPSNSDRAFLVVMGTTNASIPMHADIADAYPRLDQTARIDLSQSGAGAMGPATNFSADWDDGSRQVWQTSPILEHGYNAPGDHIVHVYAANDAGQVSTQAVAIHVGRPPPQNFLQDQFSNENQNRTFFVMGLIVTGLGALYGILATRRKRDRLARELRALEQVHQLTRNQPRECERALNERRIHARALLVDTKLDEGQFAVLERRIDELARGIRMADIEQEFGFLTVSMASLLRGFLTDGRIERWERDHFLEALSRDEHLTPEQKTRVRTRIDEWFDRDSGGTASQ